MTPEGFGSVVNSSQSVRLVELKIFTARSGSPLMTGRT